MIADSLWSCVMLLCGPLRYLVIPQGTGTFVLYRANLPRPIAYIASCAQNKCSKIKKTSGSIKIVRTEAKCTDRRMLLLIVCYPRESFRQGLWNHRRTFVCLFVCLSVATITK